jgi:hypothetical protein
MLAPGQQIHLLLLYWCYFAANPVQKIEVLLYGASRISKVDVCPAATGQYDPEGFETAFMPCAAAEFIAFSP